MRTLTQTSLISSIATVSSYKELPKISAFEMVISPQKQILDQLFSDVVHLNNATGGTASGLKVSREDGRVKTKLVKRLSSLQLNALVQWLHKYKLDEPLIIYTGSDVVRSSVSFKLSRTFVSSSLENDLKYRLAIQEFYLDKSNLHVHFVFNEMSSTQPRSREALLRLNYFPIRLIKRLVNTSK